MLVRSFLLTVFAVCSSTLFANDANWNCRQDPKTKAWDCVGTSASQPADTKPEPKIEQSQEESSVFAKPVESEGKPENTDGREADQRKAVNKSSPSLEPNQAEAPIVSDDGKATKVLAPEETPPDADLTAKPDAVSEAPPALPASEKPVPNNSGSPATTSAGSGNKRGWSCDNKGKDDKWNCQLVGADPKGEARTVETEDPGFTVFDPTFDAKQELVFNTLRDRFKNNPWGNCTMQLGTQKYFLPDKKQRDYADIDMNSNAAELYDNEIGNYRGNVDMKRADQRASANAANYDSVSELLDLHGNVFYSEDEISLYTESANLKLASDEARLRDALFIAPTTPIRGKASAVYRDSDYLTRYKDASYTSCEPGNQDWIIHASDVKMNKKSGEGSAKNAWLEFKGVPVFYSPYLNFPLDSRRKTGLLPPDFGNTGRGGFRFGLPFYWNIAPNFDATLKPRYYTKRGFMFAGDFRYMTEKTKGSVSAEFLPGDKVSVRDAAASERVGRNIFKEIDKDRYFANFKNHTTFTPRLNANADLYLLSDNQYFNDLGNALSIPTFSYLRNFADVTYADQGLSIKGLVEKYRIIDPNLVGRLIPYRRLPQLNLNFEHAFNAIPANVGIESEYAFFEHSESDIADGQRFNIKPYVSFPLKTASAYVTPKLSLQYTQYWLDNQGVGNPDSVSRVVPIGSIDAGVFLEKNLNIAGGSYLHTLEPRLFYLYIPKVNQNDIPIFDTSLYDFQYESMFRENRYSGTDRIQDANQIGLGFSSRLVDSTTGLEKLKLNIGQIFYFQDREVIGPVVQLMNPRNNTFLNNVVQNSFFSPLVAELSGRINKHVMLQTGLQFDPDVGEIVRGNASLRLERNPGELFNIGYTYRKNYLYRDALDQALSDPSLIKSDRDLFQTWRDSNTIVRNLDIIQSDISFRWPLFDNWYAVGRWQYSLLFNQSQDAFVGLQKETCCWRFSVMGRRFVNNSFRAVNRNLSAQNQQFESQTGIFLQIDFKGFTGLGNADLEQFFTQSILGYRKKSY